MGTTSVNEERLISKLTWKILPFIFLLFVIAMLDRVNISYASLTMNKELGISASTFGLIAGIFFIGYFFFEIPSNVIMHKVGAKKWIARILISWGIVCVLEGFVKDATQLTILRFLLGVAEAGFYPCIILYLTYWFPNKYLARAVSLFMVAIPVANIFGGPISGWLMDSVQLYGIASWRWMLILEGVPAIIFGAISFFVLVDRPADAKFLTKEEKDWLLGELQKEYEAKIAKVQVSKWSVMKNGRVWHMAFAYMTYVLTLFGFGMWLPQIIKGLSSTLSSTQVGVISAIPYIIGAVAMVIIARHSDKTNERRLHVALPISLAFIGFIGVTQTQNIALSIILISISCAGIMGFVGSFWTIPNLMLGEATAAVGIALINSFGNLGGFLGPYGVGYLKDLTGSTNSGMYVLAIVGLLGTILVLTIPKKLVTPDFIDDQSQQKNLKVDV